jgi:hypothetical protein
VFDDPRVGLDKEPFVSGADSMIDRLVAGIPIQWNTQVTLTECKHAVSQVYCSACQFPIPSIP